MNVLPYPIPDKCNFTILHSVPKEKAMSIIQDLICSQNYDQIPAPIAKLIYCIVFNYAPLFSAPISITFSLFKGKKVYLINSSDSCLCYISGTIWTGPHRYTYRENVGLVIFAKQRCSQAIWVFDTASLSNLDAVR